MKKTTGNIHWDKNLSKFNLSEETINVIERLRYDDSISLQEMINESNNYKKKYYSLKNSLKTLINNETNSI